MQLQVSAATRKHIMVGQKYVKGGGQTSVWGEQTYTKWKINNNSGNIRRARLLPGGGFRPLAPFSCGPALDHDHWRLGKGAADEELTAIDNFWKFVSKITHLKPISAKIQPKNLKRVRYYFLAMPGRGNISIGRGPGTLLGYALDHNLGVFQLLKRKEVWM